MSTNTDTIKNLLEEGKLEEAKLAIKDFINAEMTPEEKGAIFNDLALLYMKLQSQIDEKHIAFMKDGLDALKTLNKAESAGNDAIKLDEIRAKLE